jgi:archaemetzincin
VRVAPRQEVLTKSSGGKHSADAIQRSLLRALPPDAVSIIALTNVDVYAEDAGPSRLLFGQGHYYNRTAVASLNRLGTHRDDLLYHRAFKLTAHELTHTFGLRHCTHYRCLLNSSGSVSQSDARPLELCPDCLRKLHSVMGFDPVERCRDLDEATQVALPSDQEWFRARLSYLTAP